MANIWSIDSAFPEHQMIITPDDDTPLPRLMIVEAVTDGDVEIVDKDGVAITYTVAAGWRSGCAAKYVGTGTTATVVGYY